MPYFLIFVREKVYTWQDHLAIGVIVQKWTFPLAWLQMLADGWTDEQTENQMPISHLLA